MLSQKFSIDLNGLRLTLVFIGWTWTSFLCHECGKMFLQKSEVLFFTDVGSRPIYLCVLTLTITCVQCATCLLTTSYGTSWLNAFDSIALQVLMGSHFLATWATNYSMAYVEASTTFTIKMTEPVTMVLAQYLVFRTPITIETIISLPVIIGGALVFCGKSIGDTSLSIGIALAFLSNLILASRNLAMKKIQKSSDGSKPTFRLESPRRIALVISGHVILNVLAFFMGRLRALPERSSITFACLSLSALAHVSYSYISLNVVLKTMSVVTHSIANIFKRLSVVLLLYAVGYRHANGWHFVGLAMAGAGLYLYVQGRKVDEVSSQDSTKVENRPVTLKRHCLIFVGVCALLSLVAMVIGDQEGALHLRKLTGIRRPGQEQNTATSTGFPIVADKTETDTNSHLRVEDISRNSTTDVRRKNQNKSEPETPDQLPWELEGSLKETDRGMSTLTTNEAIINEAQRILIGLLRHFLGPVKNVMLIEIADYQNKGDPAISSGELILLNKMNITIVFSCAHSKCVGDLNKAKTVASWYHSDDLVILFQGGGNLVGYPKVDKIRQSYIEAFHSHKMILMSQSIWLTSANQEHLITCRRIYSHNKNLILFLRDRQSLSIARENFKGVTLVLAPDMSLGIGMVPRQLPPTHDIIWLKRRDGESANYKLPTMPSDLKVHVSDWYNEWESNTGTTAVETALLITSAGFQFLQRGRIVITDRLHGHILSTLMHIPHVIIDNPPFYKLSSYHKCWTHSLSNTILVSNGTFAIRAARKLILKYHTSLPRLISTA